MPGLNSTKKSLVDDSGEVCGFSFEATVSVEKKIQAATTNIVVNLKSSQKLLFRAKIEEGVSTCVYIFGKVSILHFIPLLRIAIRANLAY